MFLLKSLNTTIHINSKWTQQTSVLIFSPAQPPCSQELEVFPYCWLAVCVVGIILGGMDSAMLIRNQKPYNRVNGGEQLTGNTPWILGCWLYGKSKEGKWVSGSSHGRQITGRRRLHLILNLCKANLWKSLKTPFLKPPCVVTGIT